MAKQENGMTVAMEMDKGEYLGRVTLELWDNALPDVDFRPEKGKLQNFTWRHITIMKSGLTKAMKNMVVEELRVEKEAERRETSTSKPAPLPSKAKTVEEEFLEIKDVVDPRKTKEGRREALLDAQTKPDLVGDGGVDPDVAKIKAARNHIPEGLDDVGPGGVRSAAQSVLNTIVPGNAVVVEESAPAITPFELKTQKREEEKKVRDEEKEELVIPDKPMVVKKAGRFANSPA